MRNLKRALSLTLASVMLLGMMVVGASAKGYPDVSEEDNVEAIEVLQAIEVMRGDDNGNFNPDSPVTRSEMAVVMALLLNLDYQYYESTCPFWDVPTWARSYVGACYANGIVSGYNDNTYGAADGVTAVQAASMMMRALGYFQYAEDYAGNFELSTVKQGTEIGIFDGVGSSATASMTRNQVAKMALNALRSEMVTFTGTRGTTYTASSGETLTIGYVGKYESRTSTEAKYRAIEGRTSDVASDLNHKGQYYVQLGEELYNGDLRLDNHAIDAFGRPSRYWQYKGDEIGTYAKTELLIGDPYTLGVKGNTLYADLGTSALQKDELTLYVDGALKDEDTTAAFRSLVVRSNNSDLTWTGRGVQTEVYRDTSGDVDEITVVIINTYLARAVNDYNTATESIRLNVYWGVRNAANAGAVAEPVARYQPFTVDIEDFAIVEGMKANDVVRVTMAAPDHRDDITNYVDYTIESIDDVEKVADVTLKDYAAQTKQYDETEYKRLSDVTTKEDDTRYNAAEKAVWSETLFYQYSSDVESQLRNATYNIYLDQFGNMLGIEQVEKVDNYVFVVGYEQGSTVLAQAIDQALVIYTDGTMETVRIDDSKLQVWSDTGKSPTEGGWVDARNQKMVNDKEGGKDAAVNTWCTYTEKSDGTLVLDKIVRNQGIQSRYALSKNGAEPEQSYIDSVRVTLTSGYDYDNYKNSRFDMKSAVAYGNDDSVYICVKADKTVDPAGGSIVKVNNVGTGLRNVSVRPDSTAGMNNFKVTVNNADGDDVDEYADTFFIYNSKGFVTYAVVVGTNGAAGYEYLYLNSAIKRTTDDQDNDRYLYDFEAIYNGELTTMKSQVPGAYRAYTGLPLAGGGWDTSDGLPPHGTNNIDGVANYTVGGRLLYRNSGLDYNIGQGDVVRATIDKDGIITEMVLLPETLVGEMGMSLNDDYGYTLKIHNTASSRDRDGETISKLTAAGNTLWVYTERTEDNCTLVAEDVKVFVNNPSTSKEKFTVYSDIKSAVDAVNSDNVVVQQVTTMNDGVTGYAHTVIITVSYAGTPSPSAPSVYDLILSGDLYDAKVYKAGASEDDVEKTQVNGNDSVAGIKRYSFASVPGGQRVVIEDNDIVWGVKQGNTWGDYVNGSWYAEGTIVYDEKDNEIGRVDEKSNEIYRWIDGVFVVANRNSRTITLVLNGAQKEIHLSQGSLYDPVVYPNFVWTVTGDVYVAGYRLGGTVNPNGTYNFVVSGLTAGLYYNLEINGKNYTNVLAIPTDEGGKIVLVDQNVTPDMTVDGVHPTFLLKSVEAGQNPIVFTGKAAPDDNGVVSNVSFTISQPRDKGALLVSEIAIGEGAVAKITWYDEDGNKLAEGTLSDGKTNYKPEITIIPANGVSFGTAEKPATITVKQGDNDARTVEVTPNKPQVTFDADCEDTEDEIEEAAKEQDVFPDEPNKPVTPTTYTVTIENDDEVALEITEDGTAVEGTPATVKAGAVLKVTAKDVAADKVAVITYSMGVDENEPMPADGVTVTGNITIKVELEDEAGVGDTWTVTFDLNGGTSAAIDAQTVANGGMANKPADPERTGYDFDGWFTAAEDGTMWDFENDVVEKNTTLYAQWTVKSDYKYLVKVDVTDAKMGETDAKYENQIPAEGREYAPNAKVTIVLDVTGVEAGKSYKVNVKNGDEAAEDMTIEAGENDELTIEVRLPNVAPTEDDQIHTIKIGAITEVAAADKKYEVDINIENAKLGEKPVTAADVKNGNADNMYAAGAELTIELTVEDGVNADKSYTVEVTAGNEAKKDVSATVVNGELTFTVELPSEEPATDGEKYTIVIGEIEEAVPPVEYVEATFTAQLNDGQAEAVTPAGVDADQKTVTVDLDDTEVAEGDTVTIKVTAAGMTIKTGEGADTEYDDTTGIVFTAEIVEDAETKAKSIVWKSGEAETVKVTVSDPAETNAKETVVYTLSVTGGEPSNEVVITSADEIDSIPAGAVYTVKMTGESDKLTVTGDVAGTLNIESGTVEVKGKVDSTAVVTVKDGNLSVTGNFEGKLTVEGTTGDNRPEINISGDLPATADVTVNTAAKLAVTGENNCMVKVDTTGATSVGSLFRIGNTNGLRKLVGESTWVDDNRYASPAWQTILAVYGEYDASAGNDKNTLLFELWCGDDLVYQEGGKAGFVKSISLKPGNSAEFYWKSESFASDGITATSGECKIKVYQLGESDSVTNGNESNESKFETSGLELKQTWTFTLPVYAD